jgi:lipopolysaccharide/colanic/teichoic acid biosynthesis glycosyltransferase
MEAMHMNSAIRAAIHATSLRQSQSVFPLVRDALPLSGMALTWWNDASGAKRFFDILAAAAGLIVLSPMLAAVSLLVLLTSGAPVVFHQVRVGRHGQEFRLYKFRTMRTAPGAEHGSFDAGNTSRVTRAGEFLRKWKLDEILQLWNVLVGDMSLVGPRPEVRKWVDAYPERWARVLTVRPGITDHASIVYRNEEEELAKAEEPEQAYRHVILPRKLRLYEEYVRTRTFACDIGIIIKTLRAVLGGAEYQGNSAL